MQSQVECPKGVCPNCWGHQEYDNKIREILKDEQIDINNHQKVQTFIKAFVTKHLDGIKLKRNSDETSTCPACQYHQ